MLIKIVHIKAKLVYRLLCMFTLDNQLLYCRCTMLDYIVYVLQVYRAGLYCLCAAGVQSWIGILRLIVNTRDEISLAR